MRSEMETRLGADFADVRLHDDAGAARSAAEVGARAYTSGRHVVIGAGGADKHTLAHELTHVIQQRTGPVAGTDHGEGLKVSDPSDRFEQAAEENATRVMRGSPDLRSAPESRRGVPVIHRPGHSPVQRTVEISFEESPHEMEEFDCMQARITEVVAVRSAHPVAVENKFPTGLQRAHVTSDTVFQNMLVRLLSGRTWSEAWAAIRGQFVFLDQLLTQWYAHRGWRDTDKTGSRDVRKQLPGAVQNAIGRCDAATTRGGHPVAGVLYAARLKAADPSSWVYYDHDPTGREADPSTHLIKPWELKLDGRQIKELQDVCETWVELRSKFPWTSLEADSSNTSDRTGPDNVENAVAAASTGGAPGEAEFGEICRGMLQTFEFYPASITEARTIRHAAVLAARHVVEHLRYHPGISRAWYDGIAAGFPEVWFAWIEAEVEKQKPVQSQGRNQQEETKNRKRKKGNGAGEEARETGALVELLRNRGNVVREYREAYQDLSRALG
ncbi:DUF4157 domain-containing protein [Kitasatospora kazusensis]|uniref:eCIS core domain-containing protein n=1 Tax=Kitasatospora kazusensis TaxID=407974 RepID=UPI003CD08122